MDIKFSEKELKAGKIDFPKIRFCYLLAIKEQNPEIWAQMKQMIKKIDNM